MSKTLKSVDYGLEKIFDGAQDFLPLLGTDFCRILCWQCQTSSTLIKQLLDFNH